MAPHRGATGGGVAWRRFALLALCRTASTFRRCGNGGRGFGRRCGIVTGGGLHRLRWLRRRRCDRGRRRHDRRRGRRDHGVVGRSGRGRGIAVPWRSFRQPRSPSSSRTMLNGTYPRFQPKLWPMAAKRCCNPGREAYQVVAFASRNGNLHRVALRLNGPERRIVASGRLTGHPTRQRATT